MPGIARPRIWLLAPLLLALLVVRLGGPHLHLCFDGSEPPVTLHVTHSDHHAEHHIDEAHDDVDVSLSGEVIRKVEPAGLDLQILLLAAVLLSLPSPRRTPRPASRPTPRASSPPFLRPPLRGPPIASA